uniref:Uncharacterized protein n=1 Tax=Spongospora subterranea TaxID=70186 RepID=A0A0H5RC68_9EUKA|eukprot:CRZ11815.1 hypothetical protein [Spongospora subterranea]
MRWPNTGQTGQRGGMESTTAHLDDRTIELDRRRDLIITTTMRNPRSGGRFYPWSSHLGATIGPSSNAAELPVEPGAKRVNQRPRWALGLRPFPAALERAQIAKVFEAVEKQFASLEIEGDVAGRFRLKVGGFRHGIWSCAKSICVGLRQDHVCQCVCFLGAFVWYCDQDHISVLLANIDMYNEGLNMGGRSDTGRRPWPGERDGSPKFMNAPRFEIGKHLSQLASPSAESDEKTKHHLNMINKLFEVGETL